MARKPSVSAKDVAALAGVSVGTVSNVINAKSVVADATRRRVEVAIDKLGWIPSEPARQLRAGRSKSIGMVVLDIGNPFFTDIIASVEIAIEEQGYSVQVGNSAQDLTREVSQLVLFAQQRVRGVLLAPIEGVDEQVRQLRARDIPVVLLDRAGSQSEFCSVSVDDVAGGEIAVRHLLEAGHLRIGLVGGPSRLQQVRDRRHGADLALMRSGVGAQIIAVSTPQLDLRSGIQAAAEIAAMPDWERPTAVFAANDLVAIGLLQGFVTAGLRVPDDMAIIGYDDIEFAAAAAVPLSSVRQPRAALGRRAAELLFAELREASGQDADEAEGGAAKGMHEHEQVLFQPELVVRRSSASRPARP